MTAAVFSFAAVALYLTAAVLQLLELRNQRERILPMVVATASIGLCFHALGLTDILTDDVGYNFGFFKISSLIFLLVTAATLLSLARRPLQNLLVILLPLAAVSVLISALAPTTRDSVAQLNGGMLLHIGLSVAAYAVLTIAALQALALASLDSRLRHHNTIGIVKIFPPLQLMETILFELIWLGVILLTASIASGFVFLDDIFAQHLVHKTTLTVAAWVTYSVLLWGRHQRGWRSKTAVWWTLGGFLVLMLGYFGSKFVLELILAKI
ncbi:MAG: ABC-type uncharacterized transport system permease subunit [Halieaceae bacterium]|jgi:ABC-type uncharacterized transport system permease subunit